MKATKEESLFLDHMDSQVSRGCVRHALLQWMVSKEQLVSIVEKVTEKVSNSCHV